MADRSEHSGCGGGREGPPPPFFDERLIDETRAKIELRLRSGGAVEGLSVAMETVECVILFHFFWFLIDLERLSVLCSSRFCWIKLTFGCWVVVNVVRRLARFAHSA